MKMFILAIAAISLSLTGFAQGKSKERRKGKEKVSKVTHRKVKTDAATGRYSNHQPKKVEAALMRDYPAATNVAWRKYKGDYYATFNNGVWRSTAVYHANGDRRDTRTVITREQLPGNIWTDIFNRDKVSPASYERIERPSTAEVIYRVLTGNSSSYFYDANGNLVRYAY
jgi:hypothetical protein